MTDQRPPDTKPPLSRNDRFIFGGVLAAVLVIGLMLYSTRNREEPTNQGGLISAPATPGAPGGKK